MQPNGALWWRLKYRHGGKEKLISLGVYPEVTLKAARTARDAARRAHDGGPRPQRATQGQQGADRYGGRAGTAGGGRRGQHRGTFEAVAASGGRDVHCAKVSEGHAART
ncbi:MAG: Arm DNA-binding domain-containing protein [Inhella sp.]